MQMNPGIILSGQQPDFVNTLARSTQAAQLANQNRDQNALRQLYQTQGQGIAAGDQNALNALARIDPMAALGVQSERQNMAAQSRRMGILSAQESRAVESWAMQKSAAERAAAAAQVEQGLMMGIQAYRAGDLNAVNSILQQAGEAPIASLDEFPGLAARYKGALDVLVKLKDFDAPPKADIRVVGNTAFDFTDPNNVREVAKGDAKPVSRVVMDQNGKPVYIEGDPASVQEFGKAATNQIDERILNSGAMVSRLTDTKALFKREYLEYGTRIGAEWGRLKDKMGKATPEEQALVAEFARFKTEAFNNLNTTLKELSGAAVTPQEAERLLEQLPNVGTGILDGDSPVEFQAKMEQSIKQQKMAIARYNLWQAMGKTGKPWEMGPLDSVPDMMNRRGAQIMEELRAQGLTDKAVIFELAEKQLREEVGL